MCPFSRSLLKEGQKQKKKNRGRKVTQRKCIETHSSIQTQVQSIFKLTELRHTVHDEICDIVHFLEETTKRCPCLCFHIDWIFSLITANLRRKEELAAPSDRSLIRSVDRLFPSNAFDDRRTRDAPVPNSYERVHRIV